MKIYVAGSMKNRDAIREVGEQLREHGFSCYVFCDAIEAAYAYSMQLRNQHDMSMLTPDLALTLPVVQAIFECNMRELEASDVVLVVLPCGRSAHLEAGWAVGRGKVAMIYGPMVRGEFDAMYGMASGVFSVNEFDKLVLMLKKLEDFGAPHELYDQNLN